MDVKIFFDVGQTYYLPQYLPVYQELISRGISCHFVFYDDPLTCASVSSIIQTERLPATVASSMEAALELYRDRKPEWIVFGNGCTFLDKLHPQTKTALLYHGIGIKECYYGSELMEMTVRFVEGSFRYRELRRRYPVAPLSDVGFAKLDPLFGPPESIPKLDLAARGLDPARKTLLYAPTYYPSSIEMMPDDLPARFGDCNIIVKPHHFTLALLKYRKQVRKLERWKRYGNVYVTLPEEYSLLPFFGSADLLISEASSALFEFAALNKPVVWLDFYKLRWGYRGPFRFRFTRRMDQTILQYADLAAHAPRPRDVEKVIRRQLETPEEFACRRTEYTQMLLGATDGMVSKRIADYLLSPVIPS